MKALRIVLATSAIALGATSLQAAASTYPSIDSTPGGNRAHITASIDSRPGDNHLNVDFNNPTYTHGTNDRGLDTSPGAR